MTLAPLGLVHLHTGQWASAFHYLSSAVNLKPDFASSYMYLAITLFKLEDADNACAAYEKAIKLANAQGTLEPVFHLNYAILLHQNKEPGKAKEHFGIFSDLFDALDEETRRAADPDLVAQAQALAVSMN
jgi:Bardet-Biedl syndrome 4 protein